jgi:hypothetical protein
MVWLASKPLSCWSEMKSMATSRAKSEVLSRLTLLDATNWATVGLDMEMELVYSLQKRVLDVSEDILLSLDFTAELDWYVGRLTSRPRRPDGLRV